MIIINDYMENDPLSVNNLDKTLDLVDRIRLFNPQKSIWLYTGYEWQHIFDPQWHYHPQTQEKLSIGRWRRQQIVSRCNILVDGRYIDSKQDRTFPYRGSSNQRLIDIQQSLQKGEIVLWKV